jgi:hypothetical protein
MKALIGELIQKANLSDSQAQQVAEVVRSFVASRIPDALRGPVESALTGEKVDDALDAAKNLVGGFLK